MVQGQAINIDQVVDEQKIRLFNINLLLWLFLATATDGYDLFVVGYAAPELVQVWHVNKALLGPAFAASAAGMFFGAPFFGYLGDRIGRKKAMIIAMFGYGALTMATVWVTSLSQLTYLRFATGLVLAGIYPNALALQAEFAPKRIRATMVILVCTGLSLGSSMPGWVSAWLEPHFGWPVLFFFGGAAPIVIALCMIFTIPESIKYLAMQPARRGELVKLVTRMKPNAAIAPETAFAVTARDMAPASSPLKLFADGLAPITILFWFLVIANVMTIFFVSSWMPTLFVSNGVAPATAALATSLFNIGGVPGAIVLALILDRYGLVGLWVLFGLACPAIALIGMTGMPATVLAVAVFIAGCCAHGLQSGVPAIAAVIYPTNIRAKGVGWVASVGRIGAIGGPLIGSQLVAMHVSLQTFFLAPIVPMGLAAIAAFVLMKLCNARFRGLGDAPGLQPAGALAEQPASR